MKNRRNRPILDKWFSDTSVPPAMRITGAIVAAFLLMLVLLIWLYDWGTPMNAPLIIFFLVIVPAISAIGVSNRDKRTSKE